MFSTTNQSISESISQSITQSNNRSVIRSVIQSSKPSINASHWLFAQAYLMLLVVEYLLDFDVVINLLLTCKQIKQSISPYSLKQMLKPSIAQRVSTNQYLSLTVTSIRDIQTIDEFIPYKSLIAIDFRLLGFDWAQLGEYLCQCLPPSVTSLSFHTYTGKLAWLPNTVKTLRFHYAPPQSGPWPESLESLYIRLFLEAVPIHLGLLSSSLTELNLPTFNQPVPANCLPLSLIRFAFGQSLRFDRPYSHKLEPGSIPGNVKYLIMNYSNPLLKGLIPNSVTHLCMCGGFSHSIELGAIPSSVMVLNLGFYSQPLTIGMIPNSVTTLVLRGFGFIQHFESEALPSSLTHLIGYPDIESTHIRLPSTLTHLEPLWVPESLPNTITHLTLASFEQALPPGFIPQSVTHIKFGDDYNLPIVPGMLPQRLIHLEFGSRYTQPVPAGVLPNSITHLIFGHSFDEPLDRVWLPASLLLLELGARYSKPITLQSIPASLNTLIISKYSLAPTAIFVTRSLPESLKHLIVRVEGNPFPGLLPDRFQHIPLQTSVTMVHEDLVEYWLGRRRMSIFTDDYLHKL